MPIFGAVLNEYLATFGKTKVSHITDLCLARHLRPFFGHIKVGLICRDTIERKSVGIWMGRCDAWEINVVEEWG